VCQNRHILFVRKAHVLSPAVTRGGQSGHGHFGQNRFSGNEHRVTACLAPCDAGYPVIATINNNNGLHEILIIGYKNGDRYEVNPESWTQLKGSNEKRI
jgi:hypothetical protein